MESSPKELVVQQLAFRFFDLETHIRSDSSAYINLFAQMYRRFQATEPPSSVQLPVEFTVLTKPDNPWGKPVMILDGDVWPLNDPGLLEGFVYQSILNTIVARVRSHFLIHAGVVSWGNQGIILVADSTHGKTTLVLKLLQRGFKFLSDEMAALGRSDRYVYPFPRSLRIRPGTLELAGFPNPAAGSPEWLDKLILDVEDIQPDSMGEAAPISHVIVLQDPADKGEERPDSPERELGVLVDRLDGPFLEAVRQIEGVTEVHTETGRGHPLLRIHAARRTFVLSQIEALCQEKEILILDVIKRIEGHPAFKAPARLETIPRSQAVIELLRRFQGGHKSVLLQNEFGGSSTRLFIELAAIIDQANCYQLFVGPLNEMADLVCGLVGAPQTA
ncbi:MAG: hypothetical protein V3S14_07000 [Anaerolineae bacterium]